MTTTVAEQSKGAESRQWYDSVWLARYLEARDIVARVAPRRLGDFVSSFDVLRVPADFRQRSLPQFLSEERLAAIRQEIKTIPMDRLEMHELKNFGRFVVHGWPAFTALQAELTERVSEIAGEAVEPSYNFLSLYSKLGICEPHLDAPSAKWTLDICLGQSEPWPISFSQVVPWPDSPAELRAIAPEAIRTRAGLDFRPEVLTPGDAILFSGTNQWHYRDALPQGPGKRFCDLLFLHYIPQGAAELVQPQSWARLFGIPELAEMNGLDQSY